MINVVKFEKNPEGFLNPAWLFKEKCSVGRDKYIHTGDHIDYYIWVDDVGKAVVLVFQESDGKYDWKHNFQFAVKPYKHQKSVIKAHRGFVNTYKSANDEIMEAFIKECAKHPDYDFVVCGWSMGGALSHLAAEDFNFRTRCNKDDPDTGKKVILITFGSPLVLWGKKTQEYFKKCIVKAYNFSHIRDIVTEVPPYHFGYKVVNKIKIALKEWCIFRYFNPWHCHTHYYEEKYYEGIEY